VNALNASGAVEARGAPRAAGSGGASGARGARTPPSSDPSGGTCLALHPSQSSRTSGASSRTAGGRRLGAAGRMNTDAAREGRRITGRKWPGRRTGRDGHARRYEDGK
jgi:hypothetical protein